MAAPIKSKKRRVVKKRIERMCVVCGCPLYIVVYDDRTYYGGRYFGKIPTGHEREKAEYWECWRCYR